MKKFHLLVALCVLGCYASVANAITGSEIVERVQKKLNEYNFLKIPYLYTCKLKKS